jgi:PAS domain-containing protein
MSPIASAPRSLEREANTGRVLFSESRDGLLVITLEGRVFSANASMAAMLGYTREELGQLHIWDWDAQLTREELLERLRELSVNRPPTKPSIGARTAACTQSRSAPMGPPWAEGS